MTTKSTYFDPELNFPNHQKFTKKIRIQSVNVGLVIHSNSDSTTDNHVFFLIHLDKESKYYSMYMASLH